MTVRNRGSRKAPHWHYDFMINGRRYRGAVKEARTKAEAEQAETIIRLKVYEKKYGKAVPGEAGFAEYVRKTFLPWAKTNKRSWANDERYADIFCEFFAGKSFNDIDRDAIEAYKEMRRRGKTRHKRERAPASVNRELEVLGKIFSLAADDGLIESNPCRKVKKLRTDNQRTRHLTLTEEKKLMDALTGRRKHLKPIVTVALYTGMRRGELLSLRKCNVDFCLNLINVKQTKTSKDRTVPMEPAVRETLETLCAKLGDEDFVFTSPQTAEHSCISYLHTGFRAACDEAGIKDLRFHDLRHTFGTRLADSGVDIVKIAELMGHDSIQTTRRYCHATDEGKRAAIDELSRYRERHSLRVVTNEKRQAS